MNLVEDVVHEEKCSLFHYLVKSKKSLLEVVHDPEASQTKCKFVQQKQSEQLACYSQKALHGYFGRPWDKLMSWPAHIGLA